MSDKIEKKELSETEILDAQAALQCAFSQVASVYPNIAIIAYRKNDGFNNSGELQTLFLKRGNLELGLEILKVATDR